MVHEDVYKRTLAHLHKTHTLIETACTGIILVDKQPGWFSTLAGPLYHGFKQLRGYPTASIGRKHGKRIEIKLFRLTLILHSFEMMTEFFGDSLEKRTAQFMELRSVISYTYSCLLYTSDAADEQ